MDSDKRDGRCAELKKRIAAATARLDVPIPHIDSDLRGNIAAREAMAEAQEEIAKLQGELRTLNREREAEEQARALDWLPASMRSTVRHSDQAGCFQSTTMTPAEILAVPLPPSPVSAFAAREIDEERAERGRPPLYAGSGY